MAVIDSTMTGSKRARARDSLLLSTELTIEGAPGPVKVRVRDLSGTGMRVDGQVAFVVGARTGCMLRTVGPVEGRIVWAKPGSAGIVFDAEIETAAVRQPVTKGEPVQWRPPPIYSRRPGLRSGG